MAVLIKIILLYPATLYRPRQLPTPMKPGAWLKNRFYPLIIVLMSKAVHQMKILFLQKNAARLVKAALLVTN